MTGLTRRISGRREGDGMRTPIELHPCRIRPGLFMALVWRDGQIIQVIFAPDVTEALNAAVMWNATHGGRS